MVRMRSPVQFRSLAQMNVVILGVYILECRNGRYYVGSAKNVLFRFSQHENGKVTATKYVLPVILRGIVPCQTPAEARKLEWKIKKSKSRKVIEQLIDQYPYRG
ncbi:MAG: GIY-YIG nuclease family protein [Bacteroidetes bacterium]|nr:MAG: GIY-YIG nuclease family protein [Bacteroidota bacterium]